MQNVWFPYFSLSDRIAPLNIVSAKGSKLKLENGAEIVDAISSWWSVCHGYQHPYIIEKMQEQLAKLSHVMFGGITHQPAEKLSEKLIHFLEGKELSRVFFSDSGSTAVEVGMKMAIQFWHAKGEPLKNRILCFENGYHGETLGALSVSHSMSSFFPKINETLVYKIPSNEDEFKEFENFIAKEYKTIAGGIIEPLLQGAGGMKIHKAEDVKKIWSILKKYDILIIADECATGFYRTGTKFAFMQINMEPDILILGKALTAGYIPFAATVSKEYIFQEICHKGRFLHGPTFMGNPLCCIAALASIELFEREDYFKKVQKIEQFFKQNLKGRVIGGIWACEIDSQSVMQIKKDVSEGKTKTFLRPFGNIIYAMPPLTIAENELEIIKEDISRYITAKD